MTNGPQMHLHGADTIVIARGPGPRWALPGALAFVAGGAWLTTRPSAELVRRRHVLDADLVGWTTIIFFGLCALVLLWARVTAGRPGLTVDARGIVDRSQVWRTRFLPWVDVAGIQQTVMARRAVVEVVRADGRSFYLGAMLRATPDEVCAALREGRARWARPPGLTER